MKKSAKVFTNEQKIRLKKTAERVKALKDDFLMSYDELAHYLGISESTIRNYAKQRSLMREEVAKIFEKKTNVHIWQYWTGETDCISWEEYRTVQSIDELKALSEIEKEEQKKREQYKSLFSLCGFQYIDLSLIPEYEFDPEIPGQHRITDTETGITATLSDSELQTLIDRLRSTTQVECFIKSKQA